MNTLVFPLNCPIKVDTLADITRPRRAGSCHCGLPDEGYGSNPRLMAARHVLDSVSTGLCLPV